MLINVLLDSLVLSSKFAFSSAPDSSRARLLTEAGAMSTWLCCTFWYNQKLCSLALGLMGAAGVSEAPIMLWKIVGNELPINDWPSCNSGNIENWAYLESCCWCHKVGHINMLVPSGFILLVPEGHFQIENSSNGNELEAAGFIHSKKKKKVTDGMDKDYSHEIILSWLLGWRKLAWKLEKQIKLKALPRFWLYLLVNDFSVGFVTLLRHRDGLCSEPNYCNQFCWVTDEAGPLSQS